MICLLPRPGVADTQFISLVPSYIPSYFGLGIGSYPDFVGSGDREIGVAPLERYSWREQKYVSLEVTYATVNLIEDGNWGFGPAGIWRFGREDVEDDVVDELPDIDGSLELVFSGAYEFVEENPRDRWWVGANFTHGATGDNDG